MFNRLTVIWIVLFNLFMIVFLSAQNSNKFTFTGKTDTVFCTHPLVLDEQHKILPWFTPQSKAYDHFLHLRWDFIKNHVPNSPGPAPRSNYPQYYFFCAFVDKNGQLEPDWWMNDIGEKIPNWFESARLYYAYTGDSSVMKIVRDMIDYQLEHGTSAPDFAWPNFPYTTTNAGDTLFRGFTNLPKLALHEIQVDHAAEVGLTYYRMYLFSGEKKYLDAAINVADVLSANARIGNAEKSVWPYRVIMKTGEITAEYGANWTGAWLLLDNLIKANLGNVKAYVDARQKAKDFLLNYPMKTGYWTDGHSDTGWDINTYKSNLSASNMTLCLFDFPELDPDWQTDIPKLIKWTEDNFVFRSLPGEPSTMWGANIVGEQDSFLVKMDYQTARYAAECARWYALSGDEAYKEKAFRALNWVTYCNDSTGKAFESPVSKGVNSWWSDSYGECPRMFYHAFAGAPEWAPPGENHILYSEGILKDVVYAENRVTYRATNDEGIEYLRLAFKPVLVSINKKSVKPSESLKLDNYTLKDLGNGDYAMNLKRSSAGEVVIAGPDIPINIDGAVRLQKMEGFGVNINSAWWLDGEYDNTDVDKEDEFLESITALFYYARNTAGIQFALVSPMNETELDGREGPNMKDGEQFVRVIKNLAIKLDAIGMSDIRFVAPDAAGEDFFTECFEKMITDDYLVGKLAHWGVHQYGDDAANYRKIIYIAENQNKSFWVTETAGIGNLFGQLDDFATAYIFWDGFDCVYQHGIRNGYGNEPPNDWVFWIKDEGRPLIAYNSNDQSWTPRKQYYEFAQIFKFIKPGAVRIAAAKDNSNLALYAFHNPDGQLVIVGRNDSVDTIRFHATLNNVAPPNSFNMFYTDSLQNLSKTNDITIVDNSFTADIPAKSVFTLAEKFRKPEPSSWYAGDMHVHRDCGGPVEDILPEDKFIEKMKVNDLAVISVLADMGNAEVKPSEIDLKKVTGQDYPLSVPGRTIHYDAEWHWDPFGTTFEHKALGGHVVLLGLTEAHQIWDESSYKILEYGRKQNAIVGFCHTEYLDDTIQNDLNCCIPIEYPVEAALGTIDFISEDVYGSISQNWGNYNADATINAYYKLLNCGIRLGLCAGTDYPCNAAEPFGTLLTYVNVDGPFSYRKWIEGIRDGKTVVSRNGHREFIELKVDDHFIPGDDIHIKGKKSIYVQAKWTTIEPLTGNLELVYNGNKVAALAETALPQHPVVLQIQLDISQSGWLCARRMDDDGHQTHTAPIYITVDHKPVRASVQDAEFFVAWIDNLIEKTSPGHEWNQYFTHDLDVVHGRYQRAKSFYQKIAQEAAELGY